jgi:hypothetical protein
MLRKQNYIQGELKKKIKLEERLWPLISECIFSPISYLENVKIKMYRTAILASVMYGCETWSVARGKRIVFGTRVLWRVFGSARESKRRMQNLQNETF